MWLSHYFHFIKYLDTSIVNIHYITIYEVFFFGFLDDRCVTLCNLISWG